jgi:hypothetical protein
MRAGVAGPWQDLSAVLQGLEHELRREQEDKER